MSQVLITRIKILQTIHPMIQQIIIQQLIKLTTKIAQIIIKLTTKITQIIMELIILISHIIQIKLIMVALIILFRIILRITTSQTKITILIRLI